MKFGKRRAPMDFGASNDEPALAAFSRPEPVARPEPEPAEDLLDPPAAPAPETAAPLEPPPARARLADAPVRPPARRAETSLAPRMTQTAVEAADAPPAWPIWLTALAVSGLWALAPIAFAIGYRNNVAPLTQDAFALAVFALLAIGPAAFVWGCAYMIRQGQKLAFEARRTEAMAQDMLTPSLAAAARAGHVTQAVREEIARVSAAAEEARETLLALREALALDAERLAEATAQSVRTAETLSGSLGRERTEMGRLAEQLDAQATKVSDAITHQARMVAEAADVADAQLKEAEATLSARAADLAAAAAEASGAARTAGEDLTRHIARLETAGVGVAEQARAVETGLGEQRTALITLSHALRADHEAFAQEADTHAARLQEFIAQARLSAVEMADRATKGGEALRQLMTDATLQFRDLAETAKAERAEFGQSTHLALEAVAAAAAEQRAQLESQTRAAIEALTVAAEETRQAAARHAATAREQVDQLSEAAFTAGQKANQVFEARLEEARALVEQSSKMVEEAGAATARKLEDGAAAARATLDELAAMLGELETRAQRLPAAAKGQAEQVRAAVADGIDELMAQARRTAEEAQAIDAAFQDRVRRNFEMLSEAVRLMGTVAAAAPSPLGQVAAAAPQIPAAPAAPPPPAAEEPEPLLLLDEPQPGPEPEADVDGAELAERLGLRPRLRLTPTATDQEFSTIFEAAGGLAARPASAPAADDDPDAEPEAEGETWTWKDLLASLDGADGEGERLEDALVAELHRMGVEPHKLLPNGRVEAIAAAVHTGDVEGARQVVKKLAPAATRRIARRLFTDEAVKRQTEIYVRRYKTLLEDARARDPEGFLTQNLLGSDGGRLFLLLDSAAGDML